MKSRTFLNDIYRSYLCVCFPSHVLCAAAILAGSMYLKIQLSLRHLKTAFREAKFAGVEEEQLPLIRNFPWKELFDCEYSELTRIYEFTLQFIKLIKYCDKE